MNKLLYVSDLDGTLLNSKAELSEKTIYIINELINRGVLFTYATARSFSSARKITNKLNLELPLATYNGAFLVNPKDGSIIDSCEMDTLKIESVIKAIKSYCIYPLVYAIIDGKERVSWIQGHENAGTQNYLSTRKDDYRFRPVSDFSQLFEGNIFYITIIGTQKEIFLIQNLFEGNSHIHFHIQEDTYNKGEFWLEIFRFDATKEHAVLKIRNLIKANEIICFGDNINDLSMFKVSDKCYAVSNANKNLKDVATATILSNNEDGVALWLSEHYFND